MKTIVGGLVPSRRNICRPVNGKPHVSCLVIRTNPNLHFSPPDGLSTREKGRDSCFVSRDSCLVKNLKAMLRAPSGARLVLTALSRSSPRRVVRKAGEEAPHREPVHSTFRSIVFDNQTSPGSLPRRECPVFSCSTTEGCFHVPFNFSCLLISPWQKSRGRRYAPRVR